MFLTFVGSVAILLFVAESGKCLRTCTESLFTVDWLFKENSLSVYFPRVHTWTCILSQRTIVRQRLCSNPQNIDTYVPYEYVHICLNGIRYAIPFKYFRLQEVANTYILVTITSSFHQGWYPLIYTPRHMYHAFVHIKKLFEPMYIKNLLPFFFYGPPKVPRCRRPFGKVRPLR
jgi:hypothetical protein